MWFFVIIFIITIILFVKSIDNVVLKNKEEQEKKNNILKKGINDYQSVFSTKIYHICGLPLTENSECILHLCDNQIVVEGTEKIFKLRKDKIMDINIKTSKEIQNSISGAVGGYMLLGPIGAFLGGSSTEFHRFFIIIYKNKENKEQCISFDMKDDLKIYKNIYDYVGQFKNNITEKGEIEL